MIKGWHFQNGEYHYWVGALNEASARRAVESHDKVAANTNPTTIPQSVVAFFALTNGKVVFGKVFNSGTM